MLNISVLCNMAEANSIGCPVSSQSTYHTHTLQQTHKFSLSFSQLLGPQAHGIPLFQGLNQQIKEADTNSKGFPAFQNILSAVRSKGVAYHSWKASSALQKPHSKCHNHLLALASLL